MFKVLLRWLSILLLLLPGFGWGADAAQREFAQAQGAVPDLANGAALYRRCESCHGSDGNGQINGNVPRIAGQHPRVVLKQLVDFRHGKRWDFRMAAVSDLHHFESAQELADVSAFVAGLARPGASGTGPGERVGEGERLFGARCERCHGAEAQGEDDSLVPQLAGQHYEYLVRQLLEAAQGQRQPLQRAHSRGVGAIDGEDARAIADFLSRLAPDRARP